MKKKKACIFAHYDQDCLIDDYVIYFLKSLKNVCVKIVFVSDCDLLETEFSKIEEIVDVIIAGRHGEYDFGSYKRGYLLLKDDLQSYDELIFCNDSCYGPFFPFEEIFFSMNDKKVDFWGLTANFFGLEKSKSIFNKSYKLSTDSYHLQSYFVVLKSNVFTSIVFADFICGVSKQNQKEEIIVKYEIGFTKVLMESGFVCDSYIPFFKDISNITISRWREILLFKHPFPFVKIGLLKNLPTEEYVAGWEYFLSQNFKYDTKLINNHLNRISK